MLEGLAWVQVGGGGAKTGVIAVALLIKVGDVSVWC